MATEVLVIVLAIWVLVLTGFGVWILNYFRKLTVGVEKENLIKVLERVIKTQDDFSKTLGQVQKYLALRDVEEKLHIQKVGVVRFNPFKELGGDHSFSVALLDGHDTGFIITGLHTRERTRVYAKVVQEGKSVSELSKEEGKALALAQKS